MSKENDQPNHQQNIDQSEIRKFESLASRWWDPTGEFRPLHRMNPLRADYIDQRSPVDGKTYLDVGCGGGILTESMATRGAEVSGIDMGEAPLAVAKLHALESGIDVSYSKSTAEELSEEKPESWDVVSCLEMLEHVPDPQSVITACARLTRPGGHLYFSTINRNPKSFVFAIIGAEYVLNLLPKGTHEYKKFIKPSELCQCARNAGLEIVETTGVLYNPITENFKLSTSDLDVNYMVYARKPE